MLIKPKADGFTLFDTILVLLIFAIIATGGLVVYKKAPNKQVPPVVTPPNNTPAAASVTKYLPDNKLKFSIPSNCTYTASTDNAVESSGAQIGRTTYSAVITSINQIQYKAPYGLTCMGNISDGMSNSTPAPTSQSSQPCIMAIQNFPAATIDIYEIDSGGFNSVISWVDNRLESGNYTTEYSLTTIGGQPALCLNEPAGYTSDSTEMLPSNLPPDIPVGFFISDGCNVLWKGNAYFIYDNSNNNIQAISRAWEDKTEIYKIFRSFSFI